MVFVKFSQEIFSKDGKLQAGTRKKGKVLSRNREGEQEVEALLREIQPTQRHDGGDSGKSNIFIKITKFFEFIGFFFKIERKEIENQKLKALLDETNKQMEKFFFFLVVFVIFIYFFKFEQQEQPKREYCFVMEKRMRKTPGFWDFLA